MRQPVKYKSIDIKKWDIDINTKDDRWIPARPIGHNMFSLAHRFKLALLVLLGKCDVLDWED